MNQSMTGQMLVLNPTRPEPERFNCPSCSKSFVRKAHMQRHQQQHANQKPFNCTFCSKSFKRSDVLRAHQFRCKERGDLPVPDGQSKGRKRSSCESCVKLRTRCDQDTPCARCQELGKECIRSNPNEHNGITTQSAFPRPGSRDAISIAHLLNKPPGDEFAGHFPIHGEPNYSIDEDGDSAFVDPESPSEASHWSEEVEPYDPYVGASDSAFDGFFEALGTLSFGHTAFRTDDFSSSISVVPAPTDAMSQALEPRALEIREILSTTAGNFGTTLPEAQHMLEIGPAIEQINGAEIDSLVSLYFENYHRHCPITHRPSFHATLCPLPLLLSVMALGGMYAPEAVRRHRMRALLDVIEAYVYSLPGLRDEYGNSLDLSKASDEETLHYQFEIFQGAYLIIIAQYFSGNAAAKRRARRQRYTRVLDIARSFKLPIAQHQPFLSIPDSAAFTSWVRTETRIRQFNIMYAFDTAMAIFNNIPPRIPFSELDVQLPCDSAYFELSSYAEMLSRATFPKPKMKLVEAFQKLFLPTNELPAHIDKEVWNCWDMLYLVHCLYTYVWRQTFSNPLLRTSPTSLHAPSRILDPLKLAVKNWKVIWDEIRSRLTREQMRDMGFETSADSYWTLTKLIVQRFEPRSSGSISTVSSEGNARGLGGTTTNVQIGEMHITVQDEWPSSSAETVAGIAEASAGGGGYVSLDFMPIETDCDSQGAHLRKILRRGR